MMRSTGSFSVIEDNIIAPTPRKYPNITCSPRHPRREKSSDATFREAGVEIQSILFQTRPTDASSIHQSQILRPQSKHHVSLLNLEDFEVVGNLMANISEFPSAIANVKLVTPLRASNPITLNSPFHAEERPEQSTGRLYPATGRIHPRGSNSKKELNRTRSLSWPGLPKNYKKGEKA